MPLSPGHLDWMAHLKEDAAKHRVKLDVCILEYGSGPFLHDLKPKH